ncbi:unnamed protein product [Rhodiola kirilowii]
MADVIFYICSKFSMKDAGLYLITLWYIWYARNQAKHGGNFLAPTAAISRVRALAGDYYRLNRDTPINHLSSSDFEWKPPPSGVIKVNCDASWDKETNIGSVGVIARDHDGVVIGVRALNRIECLRSVDCEGISIQEGFKLCNELGVRNLILESDCAEVVMGLNCRNMDSCTHSVWYNFCLSELDHNDHWNVFLVRREANDKADAIARHARLKNWFWTRIDACPRKISMNKIQSHVCRCRRHFSTKYTARVTSASADGRTVSITVDAPTLQHDPRGYALPRRDLICRITQLLNSQPHSSFDPHSLQISQTLTSSEVSEILKNLNHPYKALKFFQYCSSELPDFRHDCFSYNRLLLILSKSTSYPDCYTLINKVVEDMVHRRIRGNISTVNLLIGVFGGKDGYGGGVDELRRCLGLVKKWRLEMTIYTFKCLLQAYLRLDELDEALQVYKEMKEHGHKLDIFAYNMFLNALVKAEKVELTYKIFEDMGRVHCEPDEYTYTIMIRMTGNLGKSEESLELFQKMLTTVPNPNIISYNTMIQALAKGRMVDKVVFIFFKMIENNCRPNEFTYSLLLNALVADGQVGRLLEVINRSKKFVNKSINAYLVRSLSKLGHASDAHKLFCNLWNDHEKGDKDAYMSMLDSLCGSGKAAEALDLLLQIHEKGVEPDTVMYNKVFLALGKSKLLSHLHDLFEKMKQGGPAPDIFTYNILLSSYGRAGKVDEAVTCFEEIENSSCTPDIVSYNTLINCLGKYGHVDEAHMRFKEMQENGINPDVVTYSTLIECFGKSERIEMASNLFDEMLAQGCFPNIVTYNILLDCLEKCGRTAEAVDLYAKLKQQGLTPDSITHTILARLQSGTHGKLRIRRKNPVTGWVVSPLC